MTVSFRENGVVGRRHIRGIRLLSLFRKEEQKNPRKPIALMSGYPSRRRNDVEVVKRLRRGGEIVVNVTRAS